MTASKIDKLVHMANQISDFYAAMPEREIGANADHGGAALKPIAARALDALRQTVTPA